MGDTRQRSALMLALPSVLQQPRGLSHTAFPLSLASLVIAEQLDVTRRLAANGAITPFCEQPTATGPGGRYRIRAAGQGGP